MKSKAKKLKALEKLKTCHAELQEILTAYQEEKEPKWKSFLQDALIKRFEVAFEYVWKAFKAAAEFEGAEVLGPREALTEAGHFGWIDDLEFWALAMDARNGSVHDYFGIPIEDYLRLIQRFSKALTTVIKKMK